MDEARRRPGSSLSFPPGLPAVLGLLAVAAAAAAFWVTSALAADGSASSDRNSSDGPAAADVQDEDGAAADRNCPERDGEPEQSSDV